MGNTQARLHAVIFCRLAIIPNWVCRMELDFSSVEIPADFSIEKFYFGSVEGSIFQFFQKLFATFFAEENYIVLLFVGVVQFCGKLCY